MIKCILILFIIFSLKGCNVTEKFLNTSYNNFNNTIEPSISAKYLTASYSIKKGDVYTASKILDRKVKNQKLLEIKFFSNLVSGKFEEARKVSVKLKLKNPNNDLYNLPQYILKIKNNSYKESLDIFKSKKTFFNLNHLNHLIKLWIEQDYNSKKEFSQKHVTNTSIYELLILENFYYSKKLIKIADQIYKNDKLNSHEILLLAGFYYRVQNLKKSSEIILTKLSDQFDKHFIIKNFSNDNNIFSKIQKLDSILASKIFNIINENKLDIYKSHSYKKIMLEFSIFLNPKMDISKYSLAEIYNTEKTNKYAVKKLNSISKGSFFFLAANLKKLSIIKNMEVNSEHETLLFNIVDLWPENKIVLYRLANYYKTKKQYHKSIKIYENILENHKTNDHDLFLYASNLDKIGKWDEAKVLFFDLLKKNPKDAYTLNYLSYKLALKEQQLELAFNLIKKALVLNPENGYFLDTLGWVEFKRKNYKNAVYFLEKSVSILPKSAEVINHLGDCYLMLNRKREAVFEWNKALKYETNNSVIKIIKEKIKKHDYLL